MATTVKKRVSAEFFRIHLAILRNAWKAAQKCGWLTARESVRDVVKISQDIRAAARCLLRSDAPGVSVRERAEAESLIDSTAGWMIRNYLTARGCGE